MARTTRTILPSRDGWDPDFADKLARGHVSIPKREGRDDEVWGQKRKARAKARRNRTNRRTRPSDCARTADCEPENPFSMASVSVR